MGLPWASSDCLLVAVADLLGTRLSSGEGALADPAEMACLSPVRKERLEARSVVMPRISQAVQTSSAIVAYLWHDREVGEAIAGPYGRWLGQACHAGLRKRASLSLFLVQESGSVPLQVTRHGRTASRMPTRHIGGQEWGDDLQGKRAGHSRPWLG